MSGYPLLSLRGNVTNQWAKKWQIHFKYTLCLKRIDRSSTSLERVNYFRKVGTPPQEKWSAFPQCYFIGVNLSSWDAPWRNKAAIPKVWEPESHA